MCGDGAGIDLDGFPLNCVAACPWEWGAEGGGEGGVDLNGGRRHAVTRGCYQEGFWQGCQVGLSRGQIW